MTEPMEAATELRVRLKHETRYQYQEPVTLGPQLIRLRPTPYCRTRILEFDLSVQPSDHYVNWIADPNGNWMARFVFTRPTDELRITVGLTAALARVNPFDFFLEPGAEQWPFEYSPSLRRELVAHMSVGPAEPSVARYIGRDSNTPRPTVELLTSLNQRIHDDLGYEVREEAGVQEPDETLSKMSGSCRDSAWLLVVALRQLGFAARFVSGYLIQRPGGEPFERDEGSELHAWTEAYLPGAGWVGLDPTLGILCEEGHIPLAASSHYEAAAPVTGTVSGSSVALSHEISVSALPGDQQQRQQQT